MSNRELTREEKILKAKQLYSQGSRNYLIKSYNEAADQLSEACSFYEEIYGELSDALGMPYLLYAKSLIALALDENKVIDVSEEDEKNDNDLTGSIVDKSTNLLEKNQIKGSEVVKTLNMTATEENMSLTDKDTITLIEEKPGTSGCKAETCETDENDVTCNLQLAWEILELAAKIFSRQGMSGLLNLAEVLTELANIEFENNILDAAREDYKKALNIYEQLSSCHRRAMAEIYYKIGLSYIMQQLHQEAIDNLKLASSLVDDEIVAMISNKTSAIRDKELIQDLRETKQEILAKIDDIQEIKKQNITEVRAALNKAIYDTEKQSLEESGISKHHSSTASKPSDVTHLIKRKRTKSSSLENDAQLATKKIIH